MFQHPSGQIRIQEISPVATGMATGMQELVQRYIEISTNVNYIGDIALLFKMNDVASGGGQI
jgi:hypothetical protein